MTLVVARIDEENIYIQSDSRITDDSSVRSDPLCGLLKTLILHPFVSVSFAGNVHFAEKAIQRFFDKGIEDVEVLLSMLREISIESDNTTDFIVAAINEGQPKLFKVTNGAVVRGFINTWIGDSDGFNQYQTEFH